MNRGDLVAEAPTWSARRVPEPSFAREPEKFGRTKYGDRLVAIYNENDPGSTKS